jgi:hypothetical protein
MRDDRDEAWDSYSEEPSDGLAREGWDEDDWDAFLARQDVLAAKYEELCETLPDTPEREDIIAREMHWSLPEGLLANPPQDDTLLGGDGDPGEAPDQEFDTLPAYRMAQEYALAFDRQITARLRDRAATDEDARQAIQAALDIPAEIAGGHCIGYERETLCGNIACCKRALACLDASLDGLLALRKRGTLPPAEADTLLRRGRELGEAILERIEALRLRVWWR